MNKAEFVKGVAEKTETTIKDAEKAVNAVIEQLTEAFVKGENVAFIGFGTFKCGIRKARPGRNPATKEIITIAESKTVAFKMGSKLKEQL